MQKQQTRWGFILKHLVYLLDFNSNAFRELLLSPKLYSVGQNHTLILKEERNSLPTKACLSALGTQGSNNSIKIRCTSNWSTLVPKQLSSFQPSCVWFGMGVEYALLANDQAKCGCFFFFKPKFIFQVTLKQVCVKLLLQYPIITEGLLFARFHIMEDFFNVWFLCIFNFPASYLSLTCHTHI